MPKPRRSLAVLVLAILVLAGARLGCSAIADHETGRIMAVIQADLAAAATGLPAELRARLTTALDQARALAASGRLTPIARDTLRNRSEAVLADGRLEPREAEHILRLLADLPAWKDSIHALKYMGQR